LTVHQNAASRAGGKHIDFLLCSKDDMSLIIAIGLVHNSGKDSYKPQKRFKLIKLSPATPLLRNVI
jgi:hypothetical protein